MDWTDLIGHRRPMESDALRLVTLVHQLGEPGQGAVARSLEGEDLLQALDHLLRHPTTLAYVLMDHFARLDDESQERIVFARKVRQLLSNERQQHQPSRRRRPWETKPDGPVDLTIYPFVGPRWQKLDEPLAILAGRNLLQVRVITGKRPRLAYDLPVSTAEWLEQDIYPKDRNSTLYLQLCSIILELLPVMDGRSWHRLMDEIRHNLDVFCRDERIPLEQDPLTVLFYQVFQEHL